VAVRLSEHAARLDGRRGDAGMRHLALDDKVGAVKRRVQVAV